MSKTTEQFIEQANKIHNNKYTYKGEYINQLTPMIAICPIHGEFEIIPKNHLRGYGCKKCNKTERLTTETFIQRCRDKFGDLYDYTNTKYVNEHTYIEYICPIHGIMQQLPMNHLKYGCGKCGKEEGDKKKRMSFQEFLEKAKTIHGDKYTYFKEKYVDYTTKMEIFCNTCKKTFKQSPQKHLLGHGCRNCIHYKLEDDIKNILDENNIEYIFQANCKNIPQLNKKTLDFYIPSKNIAIECQGIQHFKPIVFFGGDIVKQRDEEKRKICNENNIQLLYYSQINEPYKYIIYNNVNDILKIIQQTKDSI